MMKKVVPLLVVATMALTASASDVIIDLSAVKGIGNDDVFNVPAHTNIKVTGVENRSTGYKWEVENGCVGQFNLIGDWYLKRGN